MRILRVLALALVAVLPLSAVAPAHASTGGTSDTQDVYSNVGLIASYTDGARYRCTATLVTSTVLLTAAHCTDGVSGKTAVTFKQLIAEKAPSGLPEAADPAKGFTSADITKAGYLAGQSYTHPRYSKFTDVRNWNDVAVVVLEKPVAVKTSSIAPLGTLDKIRSADLSKTLFRAVGYGTYVAKPDNGPQKPQPMSYPLERRYVDMPGQKLTPQILQTNGNEKDPRGTGGTCFGDSGGPVYYKDKIVAVTSYGYTDNCRYLGGYQRVDISVAQEWLAGFGVRP